MPYTDAGKNNMLDAIGATHAAAFDGDPTGAGSELDRAAITFGAASGGVKSASDQPQFTIPGGSGVDHIAFFDDPSAGTLVAYGTVTREDFAEQGTYTLDSADLDLNA